MYQIMKYVNQHHPSMKRFPRPSAVLSALVIATITLLPCARANYTTAINPGTDWGTWEGWGTSLAWWAATFGNRDDLADLLFTTKSTAVNGQTLPGLGMTIARYNLGASTFTAANGARMVVSPNIRRSRQIEGFWLDWTSSDPTSKSWNWSADPNQRAMLLKAKSRGVTQLELFSNSPIWWMCINHNPSGSPSGSTDNLQSWNYQAHAVYLATFAKFAKDNWGINFNSVEPLNEPIANWWKETGTQEGCHVGVSTQATVINFLRTELNSRGLNSTIVAASDESFYDMAVNTWNSLPAGAKSQVARVNVHGYQYEGGRRDTLFSITVGKKLWNSEYGDGQGDGMRMVTNLNLDLRFLHPTAWVYWQPLDGGGWGLIQADNNNKTIGSVNPKLYVFAQYSRHIRPGMRLIDAGEPNSVAAYDAAARKLVIVTANYGTAQAITLDLSRFSTAAGPVTRWTTVTGSGEKYGRHTDTTISSKRITTTFSPNTIQTFEIQNVTL